MRPSRRARWPRRQVDFLASGRLAVWLIGVFVAVLAAHLLLPQEGDVSAGALDAWVERRGLVGRLSRAVGLTDVLHSPFLWVTSALLFVNLSLCMIRRRATLRLCRFPDRAPLPGPAWRRRRVPASGLTEREIAEQLARRGYRTLVEEGRVYGLRGRFAIAGHWLFHLGLLALLAVGTAVALAPAPFRGTMGVGEGEPFDLHTTPLLSTNGPVVPELPDLRFRLRRIDVATEGAEVRRFDARVESPGGDEAALAVNRPYRQPPYQVMVHGFGYMAGWVIADDQGRMIHGAWVKLVPFPLERSDTFSLGASESNVQVRLFPDHERVGEEDRSRSHELLNPRFRARIVWQGQKVFSGLLEAGQRVPLQAGLDFLFLPEIRRYGLLEVIQERGHVAVYACLATMIFGIAIRYVRIRKEILVVRGSGAIEAHGHGEIFESLFAEEFDRLTEALASAASDPSGRRRSE